jgi:hypothetical protein
VKVEDGKSKVRAGGLTCSLTQRLLLLLEDTDTAGWIWRRLQTQRRDSRRNENTTVHVIGQCNSLIASADVFFWFLVESAPGNTTIVHLGCRAIEISTTRESPLAGSLGATNLASSSALRAIGSPLLLPGDPFTHCME